MNFRFRPRSKIASFFSRLTYSSLVVCGLGIASTPAQAAVTVAPSPLIIQASLPPNITLMLDDSGSMAWDYMPDWGYLSSTTNDAVRNSSINGTYYNPNVVYTPPPKADGKTSYPSPSSITNAYIDGFASTGATDITQYVGGDSNVNGSGANTFPEYTKFTVTVTNTYAATMVCASGDTLQTSGSNKGLCKHNTGTTRNPVYTYLNPSVPSCTSGDSLSGTQCTHAAQVNKYFFTYTKGASNTQYYVGVTGDCAYLTTAQQNVCDDTPTTQQNVANWFSYYRTRILMAKSGLLNSFATVNANYRVGFGSINGNNDSNLSNATSIGSTNYDIAPVAPFGDGTAGTQKASFWNWVVGENANGGTPLRSALDAVGQYYQSKQPWTTMSTDPEPVQNKNKELACRQSYTILTTDGFWNDSYSAVGDVDGVQGSKITDGNAQSYTYKPVAPFMDSTATTTTTKSFSQGSMTSAQCLASYNNAQGASNYSYSSLLKTCSYKYTVTSAVTYSNTLADVAMQYWESDLRTGTPNEVQPSKEDPAFWQHMTTFTLGLGFTPTGISPAGTTVDSLATWANNGGGNVAGSISGFSWPKPASNSINNIADLAHAAINGHGGFYSATSPDAFTNGLKDALKRTTERNGTGASLAANSTQLTSGTVAYQAKYVTATWTGDLDALSIDSTSGAIGSSIWSAGSAGTQLEALASSSSLGNRNIYTYNYATTSYVAFALGTGNALPSLSTSQNAALSMMGGSAVSEVDMINYLRGDPSKEISSTGGAYRSRSTPLGDIVDSQPVYAGSPDPNQFLNESFTGSSSFAKYANDNQVTATHPALIYVAANDGMLHAFDATTGAETYAYLPGAIITSGLTDLANPEYGDDVTHEYFNDGELTIADAYIAGAWKTVLVGTTGRGLAKAVYALDITNPKGIKFLWERSAADGLTNSNYMGQMTGKPVVAQTADGVWSVMIGNGYNSAAGTAALLQFSLADGSLIVHNTTDTSGLAAPGVWMDPAGNGVSTVAYAGDADGNLWSFQFSSSDTVNSAGNGTKIFTATDTNKNAQPITAGILLGKDPQTGNVWAFFGTGKYLSSTDLTDTSVQSWYGLVVQSASADNPAVGSNKTMTRDALAQRSITAEIENDPTATPPTLGQRSITTAADATSITGESGWYLDLTPPSPASAQGERMVTPNQFQGNLLLGTTRIPLATDACNPSGSGWIMAIDPFTGTNPSSNFFDANGDGKVDSGDSINGTPSAGIGFVSLPNNPIFVGGTMLTSYDNGSTSSISTSGSTGNPSRVSWRELINK